MPKTHEELMEELKQTDPELYQEIMSEVAQEIEEIRKKWGGKRSNAGRKKIYSDRVALNKRIQKDTIVLIKDYSKTHNISENEALDRLINAGYACLEKHKQAG